MPPKNLVELLLDPISPHPPPLTTGTRMPTNIRTSLVPWSSLKQIMTRNLRRARLRVTLRCVGMWDSTKRGWLTSTSHEEMEVRGMVGMEVWQGYGGVGYGRGWRCVGEWRCGVCVGEWRCGVVEVV